MLFGFCPCILLLSLGWRFLSMLSRHKHNPALAFIPEEVAVL